MTSKIKISIDKWKGMATIKNIQCPQRSNILSKTMRYRRHNQKTERAENRSSRR